MMIYFNYTYELCVPCNMYSLKMG